MKVARLGRIINISSVNGSKGSVGQTNYAAARAGMHGFTKSLALEVARKGVTVNTVSPGYLAAKMVTAISQEILDTRSCRRFQSVVWASQMKSWALSCICARTMQVL
jgi:NAD(P)-dependent dehydrogenase (short-subunit alcohol dehydrogenase family)